MQDTSMTFCELYNKALYLAVIKHRFNPLPLFQSDPLRIDMYLRKAPAHLMDAFQLFYPLHATEQNMQTLSNNCKEWMELYDAGIYPMYTSLFAAQDAPATRVSEETQNTAAVESHVPLEPCHTSFRSLQRNEYDKENHLNAINTQSVAEFPKRETDFTNSLTSAMKSSTVNDDCFMDDGEAKWSDIDLDTSNSEQESDDASSFFSSSDDHTIPDTLVSSDLNDAQRLALRKPAVLFITRTLGIRSKREVTNKAKSLADLVNYVTRCFEEDSVFRDFCGGPVRPGPIKHYLQRVLEGYKNYRPVKNESYLLDKFKEFYAVHRSHTDLNI